MSGGGVWLLQFQGCNTAINKIGVFVFGRSVHERAGARGRAYFWTVDGAWNFYMFQEKPAAPVVYGVLSIARDSLLVELLSRADEPSRNAGSLS